MDITDPALRTMIEQAAKQDAQPQQMAIEHNLNGCVPSVFDERAPDGSALKVLVLAHPSGHAYVARLPQPLAYAVAKALMKQPPPIINGKS